ncbi:MAG: hypothetical protein NZ777_14455 [Pseudomonadales bacterium]|nr:hypothetical protein [Pseudomonadales bacterium]
MLRLKNVARMLAGSFLLSAALLASSQDPEQTYSNNIQSSTYNSTNDSSTSDRRTNDSSRNNNNNEGSNHSSDKSTAEEFISAFYSWDATKLKRLMAGDANAVAILYYQGWAEAANYKVKLRRPCRIETNEIVCATTVTDDFGSAMGYEATDTFRLTLSRNKIAAVTFSGDDQTIFEELVQWITEKHPDILTGPCLDMFAGGTTPAACARAVAKAARDFMTDRGKAIL